MGSSCFKPDDGGEKKGSLLIWESNSHVEVFDDLDIDNCDDINYVKSQLKKEKEKSAQLEKQIFKLHKKIKKFNYFEGLWS